ncbi:hypothetical protein BaRGS_00036092 [Batillaria attramentaria]|uniref:Major facilitator superfamily (MFS) profile domain-containing protein n=1 Tax=Batillaria attramentaria TaxID=370345 RepID=A0ABD0JCL6_9CAEN
MEEYEKILKDIRPFGPFQVRVFVLVSMFETPLAWAMLLPMFTSASPDFVCETESNNSQSINSSEALHNGSTATANQTKCQPADSFTSIVTEWQLHGDNKSIPDHITSLQMAGVLVGALVTGQLADLLGRKKVLYSEYFLLLILWLASAFMPTWQLYAAARFFVGALVGGCLVVNFVLPLEFVTPAWRTFCGCIGFWAVGLITLSGLAFLLRDWRHLTMTTAAISVPMLFSWWFVSESPRWLISRGRIAEAKNILETAARLNKRPVPDFSGLERVVQIEDLKRQEQKKYFYWHLFSSCSMARGTLILMYGWFVSSAVYYGMNFNVKNLAGDRYLNALISGLVEIPAVIFVVCIHNRLGRRKTVALLMLLAGLFTFSILIIDLTGNLQNLNTLVVVFAMVGKFGISGGWAATQVFSAETFPTVVRNIGVGACSMAARIGGIVAPQLVLLGKENRAVPFTIFGVFALVCCCLMLLLPETVRVSLPDFLSYKIRVDTPLDDLNCQCDAPLSDKRSGIKEIGDNFDALDDVRLPLSEKESPD